MDLEKSLAPVFLDAFENRFRLAGRLVTRTGLHIGAGASGDPMATDLPVVRDGSGRPFVPGSSLKGVIRSAAEALIRGTFDRPAKGQDPPPLWSCDVVGHDPCVSDADLKRWRADLLSTPPQPDEQRLVFEEVWAKSCTVCRLFGSLALASRVRFPDLPLDDVAAPLEVRNGVGIDRDKEQAASGVLYDFEAVPPSTTFDLLVLVDNGRDHEIGLLLYLFDELHRGHLALGGKSSRGLGRVSVEWRSLEETRLERGSPFARLLDDRELIPAQAPARDLPLPEQGDQDLWRQLADALDALETVDESSIGAAMETHGWTKAALISGLALEGGGRKYRKTALERLRDCGRLVERDGLLVPKLRAEEAESDGADLARRLRPIYQRFVGALDAVWQHALEEVA